MKKYINIGSVGFLEACINEIPLVHTKKVSSLITYDISCGSFGFLTCRQAHSHLFTYYVLLCDAELFPICRRTSLFAFNYYSLEILDCV